MQIDLSSKRVIVTGASRGIGRAIARAFAAEGARVAICARTSADLEAVAEDLKARGAAAVIAHSVDVTDTEGVKQFVEQVAQSWGGVDVLINNAGLALGKDPAPQASLEDWHRMIDTNIKGLVNVTKHLLPLLSASTPGATIINLGSIAANTPYPGGHVYGATKAFVKQFSFNLRCDLVSTGVRVTG